MTGQFCKRVKLTVCTRAKATLLEICVAFARGRTAGDVLSLESDNQPGEVLLEPVMKAGRRLESAPALSEIKDRIAHNLERLPKPLRRLDAGASYPVKIADPLQELTRETDRRLAQREAAPS